jgi:hypothetical protein
METSNMNNFEEYTVRSWLDDGMTCHPSRPAPIGARVDRKPWPIKLLVPFIAATAISVLVHAPVALAVPGATAAYVGNKTTEAEPIIWGSPALYWSSAITELRAWRPVQEQDVETPPPLF